MGTAHIEVTPEVMGRLVTMADVTLITAADMGDGFWSLRVSSPLLADDCHGCQEAIIEGDTLRFKRWADT